MTLTDENPGLMEKMKNLITIVAILACAYGLLFSPPGTLLKAAFFPPQIKDYKAAELEELAHLAAILNDIDPEIFIAQMRQESNFNQHARSKVGAIGVAQIMSGTAKGWKVDPNDPMQALDAAARHMKSYFSTYKAQGHNDRTAYQMALAAYNAGPGAVAKYGGVPPYAETKNYVETILAKK